MNKAIVNLACAGGLLLGVGCQSGASRPLVEDPGFESLAEEIGLNPADLKKDLGEQSLLKENLVAVKPEVRATITPSEKAILLKVDHVKQATSVIQQDGRVFLVSDPSSFVIEDWDDKDE